MQDAKIGAKNKSDSELKNSLPLSFYT